MRRKVTKEEFRRVLDTLFPWGYTGDVEKWEQGEYFLGWAYFNKDSHLCDIMCINEDTGGIAFWLIRCLEMTPEQVSDFIGGMMHALLPDMVADIAFKAEDHVVFYYFPDTNEEEKPKMTDKEKVVKGIVSDILKQEAFDENEIKGVTINKDSNTIQVAFTGATTMRTCVAIGQAFGDDNPDVRVDTNGAISLVIVNNKVDLR